MCVQTRLYQVMSLVIMVVLHSASGQYDSVPTAPSVSNKMEKLEQTSMDTFQALPEHRHSHVKQEKTNDDQFHHASISIEALLNNVMEKFEQKLMGKLQVQRKEVVETIAAHGTSVKQLAEAINNLRNTSEKLLAAKIEIRKQLTNVENAAYQRSGKDVFPLSCKTPNIKEAGIYSIRPAGVVAPFLVLCDFEDNFQLGGGWTVFQRRFNGGVNFYRNWTMYKNGFGDVNGEHWLGLEKLHAMTRSGRHELLVILQDHDGYGRYALYDSFRIGSEAEKYKLTLGKYSGTAGDALKGHNGMKFTTFDQDNDKSDNKNCAKLYNGAWWFQNCYDSHLNGKYRRKGEHLNDGVDWILWKGMEYSLKSSKMMLRRRV